MQTVKRNLILIICLFLFAASFAAVSVNAAFAENIPQILVRNDAGNGYLYGQEGSLVHADTVQSIFDLYESSSTITELVFAGVETNEAITVNGQYKLSGQITSELSSGSVISVEQGRLETKGLVLSTNTTAITVKHGTEFVSDGDNIIVQVKGGYSCYALIINGKATLSGSMVEYRHGDTDDIAELTGGGIFQGDANSEITINDSTRIFGDSACIFNGGTVTINGGSFKATNSSYNTTNGYAVHILSGANVTVHGGRFESVTSENTIYLSGNEMSSFVFYDGSIKGRIKLLGLNNSSTVTVAGRNVRATSGLDVFVKSSEEESNGALTTSNAVLSTRSLYGYELLYWSTASGKVTEKEPSISDLAVGGIDAIAEIRNDVTFKVGKKSNKVSLAYNTRIELDKIFEYAPACPDGYRIIGWKHNQNDVTENEIFVNKADVIEAVIELSEPSDLSVSYPDNADDRVFGEEFSLVGQAKSSGAEIRYAWELFDGEEYKVIGEEAELKLKNVSDSGTYRCRAFSFDDGIESKSIYSQEIVVVIKKADSVAEKLVLGEEENFKYSRFKKLSDYDAYLPTGYSWAQGGTVPIAGLHAYSAKFVRDGDRDNYREVDTEIGLILEKGNIADDETVYAYSEIYSITYDPNLKLKDLSLPAENGYYWVDEEETPHCSKERYDYYYNPDKDNYIGYVFPTGLEISVAKATYSEEISREIFLTVSYVDGLNYDDVGKKLPEGYMYFMTPSGELRVSDEPKTISLIYNRDLENYKTVTGIKLYLTVEKGALTAPAELPFFFGTYKKGMTLSDFEFSSSDWRWNDPSEKVYFGQLPYKAVYNPNSALYNDLTVDIICDVEQGELEDFVGEYFIETVYAPNLHLHDIELPEGYAWVAEDEILVAGERTYKAKYTPKDENYKPVDVEVTVAVNKAILDMSGFEFNGMTVTYDGKIHSLTVGSIPVGAKFERFENNGHKNAGEYTVVCVLSQEDETNYEGIKTRYEAILKIEKAQGRLIGEGQQEFLYDGEPKRAAISINNGEQTVESDVENSFVDIGTYEIVFTAAETDNYLAAELSVKVTIKGKTLVGESEGLKITLDGSFDFSAFDISVEENGERLIVKISAEDLGRVKIKIELPSKYDSEKLVKALNGNEEIEFERKDGAVFFEAENPSEISLVFDSRKGLAGWAIALICVGSALAAAGVAAGTVLTVRAKRKKRVDQIESAKEEDLENVESE